MSDVTMAVAKVEDKLESLRSELSTETDQQDSYYGRNIKSITDQSGNGALSPQLDNTNAKIITDLNRGASFYTENIQGVYKNCYYFVSNAATCEEVMVTNVTTTFNNFKKDTPEVYAVTITPATANNYAKNQTYLVRTNVPIRNAKEYDELDNLVHDVDMFSVQDITQNVSVDKKAGLYTLSRATSSQSSISSYNYKCIKGMPLIPPNKFIDVGHIQDPRDTTKIKYKGTAIIKSFHPNAYIKTFNATYNGKTYTGISNRLNKIIDSNTFSENCDPFLVLRQNISSKTYASNVVYYFHDDTTQGKLTTLEAIPNKDSYIFQHIEFSDAKYVHTVNGKTVEIPYSQYKRINVKLSSQKSTKQKIYLNTSKTEYEERTVYTNVSFYYNDSTTDTVTRINDKTNVNIIEDEHVVSGTNFLLKFETLQEAVGQKAYRFYVNIQLDGTNFVQHSSYTTYKSGGTLSQFITGFTVRIQPSSNMLYGDQKYGTIYTNPITLTAEAISRFSVYCLLYYNIFSDLLTGQKDESGHDIYNFNAFVALDTRFKKRKNVLLYTKTPRLYFNKSDVHPGGSRSAAGEVQGSTESVFFFDAEDLMPCTYRKEESHPEQMTLYPDSDSDYECGLRYVTIDLVIGTGSNAKRHATLTIKPKEMTISCPGKFSNAGYVDAIQIRNVPSYITALAPSSVTASTVSAVPATIPATSATLTIGTDSSETFLETFKQATNYHGFRYYYRLNPQNTGISFPTGTTGSNMPIVCKYVTHVATNDFSTRYQNSTITSYARCSVPLYAFVQLQDAGTIHVLMKNTEVRAMPITNVINTSVQLKLPDTYTYDSIPYTPEAIIFFDYSGTISDGMTLTLTESDERNQSIETTTIKSTKSNTTITVTQKTETETNEATGKYTQSGDTITATLSNDAVVTITVTTTATTLVLANWPITTTEKVTKTIVKTGTDTETTFDCKFRKHYKGQIIPRIAGYNVSGNEVHNWFFYNGYNYNHNGENNTNIRLNGVVFTNVLLPSVDVTASYSYYNQDLKEENWIPMSLSDKLMVTDEAFAKTISTYSVPENQNNLQSAKCKIQISYQDQIHYVYYNSREVKLHHMYVDNDNLENLGAVKVTGQKMGLLYLSDSKRRLSGFSYIESANAQKEITFAAEAQKVYSIPRILNKVTKEWEVPPRAKRVAKGSLSDELLNSTYYIAIEDYIKPPTSSTKEVNHVSASTTVTYVHWWGQYDSANFGVVVLPERTLADLESLGIKSQQFESTSGSTDPSDQQINGGYCWDPSRGRLSFVPPVSHTVSSQRYVKHLIPYSKAQDFFSKMKNSKYYCFEPTPAATVSVWDELDFWPIVAVNYDNSADEKPTYGIQTAVEGVFTTIGVRFGWQEVPNITGINMTWDTKKLNAKDDIDTEVIEDEVELDTPED